MTIAIALSIQQPWAWLIVHGHKDIENRTWSTRVRGQILVHAGKKFDGEGWEWVRATRPDVLLPPRAGFELGGIVGAVRIADCVSAHPSPWFFGPFGFVLAEASPLPFFALRGHLGFFRVEGPR